MQNLHWNFKVGGTQGSQPPTSCAMFSCPLYICAPLPPHSCPSLYYSCLQVNKKDQKTGFLANSAKTYHSWPFSIEHYYRLVVTDLVIRVRLSILASHYREESCSPLCNLIAIAVSNVYLLAFQNPFFTGIMPFRNHTWKQNATLRVQSFLLIFTSFTDCISIAQNYDILKS